MILHLEYLYGMKYQRLPGKWFQNLVVTLVALSFQDNNEPYHQTSDKVPHYHVTAGSFGIIFLKVVVIGTFRVRVMSGLYDGHSVKLEKLVVTVDFLGTVVIVSFQYVKYEWRTVLKSKCIDSTS